MYWLTKYFPKPFPKYFPECFPEIAALKRSLSAIGVTAFCVVGASLSIGAPAESRYIVFVRGNNPTTLQKVRDVVPAAFVTRLPQLPNQSVIQVGAFNQQSIADRLISNLRSRGITSEKFFRGDAGKEDPTITSAGNDTTGNETTTDSASTEGDDGQNETTADNVTDNSSTDDPPSDIEINRPPANAPATPPAVVAIPPTPQPPTQTTAVPVPATQFPARFPVATNCNCQSENSLGTVSSVTVTEPNTTDSSTAPGNYRYIAAVPTQGNPQFLLNRVQQHVPSAKLMNSWRGSYVHAGAYPNRDAAESVSRFLRSKGIDSRVLFF